MSLPKPLERWASDLASIVEPLPGYTIDAGLQHGLHGSENLLRLSGLEVAEVDLLK
jgi:hypothetical protein